MLENFNSEPVDASLDDNSSALSRANLHRLSQVGKWARWAGTSILIFWGVIILLFLYIAVVYGFPLADILSSIDTFESWLLLVFYLGFFVITLVLAAKLFQFATKAHDASQLGSKQQLEHALEELAVYFKLAGITFAIFMLFNIISLFR